MKAGVLTALLAGGTVFASPCTATDIRNNLVAGSLAYIRNGATSFWDSFVPVGDIWDGLFNPDFTSQ